MTADRDTTRIVRSWLRTDEHESADRVLEDVLASLDTTPQRRHLWPSRRFPIMRNTTLRYGIAVAAVIVVAIIGYRYLAPAPSGPGASPAPTATASISPTSTVPSTPAPLPLEGDIAAGQYAWKWPDGRVTFAVPAGWFSKGRGESIGKHEGEDNEVNWGHSFPGDRYEVTHVYTDACQSEGTLAPIGPTLEDLATALTNQAASEATTTDLTLGGYPAKRIDVVIPAAQATADCRYPGVFQIWGDVAETGFFALAAGGSTGVVHAIDVDGQVLVFTSSLGPQVSATDVAELEGLIASITIEK
jgi:hypothetical protein